MKKSISFLKKIKNNNNTTWMHAHKDEYQSAKNEVEFLAQELIHRIREWDENLTFLEPKDCMFRFNRDTRFSDNKNPYKENFGLFFAYGGKKGGLPGYYLNIAPKEIFVAGGVWIPQADQLQKVRRFIQQNGNDLIAILEDKKFKKVFPALDSEFQLKRPPRGFSGDEKFIELLKYKSFTVSAPLALDAALKPGFGKVVEKHFKLMKPFNEFFREALLH